MKRNLILTITTMLLVPSFAFAGVRTDYDRSAVFERYRTFAWKTPSQAPTNGIVDNSLVSNRIMQSVNQQLGMKGLQQADSNPDLYVVYHVNAKKVQDLNYSPGWSGWGFRRWGGWWGPGAYT